MNRPSPKVFISYSWSSPEREEWVVDLAEKLSADGVHVILDKWDLKEGQDKYAFMERMVTDGEIGKVLMICDRLYAEKADGRKGGVGTESQIISPEIYAKVEQDKFIPIVAEYTEGGEPCLPQYLKSRIYVDLVHQDRHAQEYERLLRNIFNRPAFKRPPLGVPPSYLDEDAAPQLKTGHKFSRFSEAVANSKPHCRLSAADYLEALLRVHDDFIITGETDNELDEEVLAKIEAFKPYRDQFVEFITLCGRYGVDSIYFEKVIEFLERALSYHFPKREVRYNLLWFDQYRFVHRELFLYLIAALLRERALDAIDLFLDAQYFYSTNIEKRVDRFTVFESYLSSLEEYRMGRLKLNRISVAADVIHDRADNELISFEDLMQADLILALRSILTAGSGYWFPRTLVYARRLGSPSFDVFFRAQSHHHFGVVKRLLKVESKDDLVRRFEEAKTSHSLSRWTFDGWPIPFAAYMNLDKLDTA
jgi:SEFIR domain-containing protein